jgi:hypothetical protein
LLPDGYRKQGNIYPLPETVEELARLAALSLPRGRMSPHSLTGSVCYLKRCRAEYERRVKCKRARPDLEVVEGVKERVAEATKVITRAEAEVAAALSEFQLKAAEATASLTDLYSLAKSGLEKVMKGYVTGQEVNDQAITTSEFTNAAGKVLQQVAKLGAGLAPEDKEAAEAEVFAEFDKTRERLVRSSGKVMPGSETPN